MIPIDNAILGELCTITDCEHKTAPTQTDGIPLIRTPNIGRGSLILESVQRVSDSTYRIWSKRAEPQPGDLIMAREAPVGNVAIVPTGQKVCLGQRTVLIRVRNADLDPRYLNYVLNTPSMNAYLNLLSNGSTVGHLNVKDIRELKLPPFPSKTHQQKIAAILMAYDALIENNKWRIALLEKVAEEIYREWFVRLRFPGHENVRVVKGVPDGWEVLPFSKLVSINPTERMDRAEETSFVAMEDLSTTSLFFVPKETRRGGQGAKFRNRDVLFPRITPSVENGKRGFVMTLGPNQLGFGSTEFIVLREKIIGAEHIYFLTCSSEFRKHAQLSMTGASGRQRVQEECFSFFLVKTPPSNTREQFANVIAPHFLQIHVLARQIEHLRKMRDMLLPRLISGKLSVDDRDIQSPPDMVEALNAESANLTSNA
jgi:type I restriction enzyme, S subunit